MVSGGLVRGLVELADDVLERIPHVCVGHHAGMQVDGAEGLDDLAQEPGLLQGQDLLLEVEVLEHVHVGGEPVDVVSEVVHQPVRIGQQVRELVVGGVVERPPCGLLHLDLEPVRVLVPRSQLPYRRPVRLKYTVEPSQDRERKNHSPVLVGAIGASKLVSDRPDEATERAHKVPHENRLAVTITLPEGAASIPWFSYGNPSACSCRSARVLARVAGAATPQDVGRWRERTGAADSTTGDGEAPARHRDTSGA